MTLAMTGRTDRQEPKRRLADARAAILITVGLAASMVAALAAVVSL